MSSARLGPRGYLSPACVCSSPASLATVAFSQSNLVFVIGSLCTVPAVIRRKRPPSLLHCALLPCRGTLAGRPEVRVAAGAPPPQPLQHRLAQRGVDVLELGEEALLETFHLGGEGRAHVARRRELRLEDRLVVELQKRPPSCQYSSPSGGLQAAAAKKGHSAEPPEVRVAAVGTCTLPSSK